jgi:hypothetical protein
MVLHRTDRVAPRAPSTLRVVQGWAFLRCRGLSGVRSVAVRVELVDTERD